MIISTKNLYWNNIRQQPLNQRLGAAPAEIIAHIASVNAVSGLQQQASACEVPLDFLHDVRCAMNEIPECVQLLLDQPLLGVFFGKGFGSSAITDVVVDPDGKFIGLVTAVDIEMLFDRSANQWATWKENTPFLDGTYQVQAVIEEAHNDNRKNAIQYLLLHEFGHVLTAVNTFLPHWWTDPQWFKSTEEYSFLPISWQFNLAQQIIPLIKDDFELRKHVCYYTDKKLPNDQISEVYEALGKTRFPTLYAATNAYDDFAESFVSYVHSVLMKKPLEIRVVLDGVIVMTHENYWESKRATDKLNILQTYLRSP